MKNKYKPVKRHLKYDYWSGIGETIEEPEFEVRNPPLAYATKKTFMKRLLDKIFKPQKTPRIDSDIYKKYVVPFVSKSVKKIFNDKKKLTNRAFILNKGQDGDDYAVWFRCVVVVSDTLTEGGKELALKLNKIHNLCEISFYLAKGLSVQRCDGKYILLSYIWVKNDFVNNEIAKYKGLFTMSELESGDVFLKEDMEKLHKTAKSFDRFLMEKTLEIKWPKPQNDCQPPKSERSEK